MRPGRAIAEGGASTGPDEETRTRDPDERSGRGGNFSYGGAVNDAPLDPFADDPADPARQLGGDADDEASAPLTLREREDVLADLEDLAIFSVLLSPQGIRGLVVDCADCDEPHYFGWELLQGNLRQLLDHGRARVHEAAFNPDPAHYVSWDYARGYADGVLDSAENEPGAERESPAGSGTASGRAADLDGRRRHNGPGFGRR